MIEDFVIQERVCQDYQHVKGFYHTLKTGRLYQVPCVINLDDYQLIKASWYGQPVWKKKRRKE
jgi:hypothetical protein